MGALTITQQFFEPRPRLFVAWISLWVLPLSLVFFGMWVCKHFARFPRMIWVFGLRDYLCDAGSDFRRTMAIMPMAWWLSAKRAFAAPDISPD